MNPTEPEYNCLAVCPKCQRCHRGECEPKPQTPLTDAYLPDIKSKMRSGLLCGEFVPLHFARSLELKLQEAERQRDEARHANQVMTEHDIKQIQLDAIKDGMRRCTGAVAYPNPMTSGLSFWIEHDKAILTAADNLTEKDLVNQ